VWLGCCAASAHSSYTSLASLASSNDLTELITQSRENSLPASHSNHVRDAAIRRRSRRRHSLGCQTDGVPDVAVGVSQSPVPPIPARQQASDLLDMLRPHSAQAGQPCSTIMSSDGADDSISPVRPRPPAPCPHTPTSHASQVFSRSLSVFSRKHHRVL